MGFRRTIKGLCSNSNAAALSAAVGLAVAAPAAHAATKTALGGFWGDMTAWSPPGVPTSIDDVIIPAGITVSTQLSGTTVVALAKTITINPLGVLTGQDTVAAIPVGAPLTIQTDELRILSTLTASSITRGVATAGDGDTLNWAGGTVTVKPLGTSLAGKTEITVEGILKAGHGRNGGWVFIQSSNPASKCSIMGGGQVLAGNALYTGTLTGLGVPGNVVVTPFNGDALLQPASAGGTTYEPIVRAGDTARSRQRGGNIGIYGTTITIGGDNQFGGPNVRAGDHTRIPPDACGGDVFLGGSVTSVVQTVPGALIEAGQPGWNDSTKMCDCTAPQKPKIVLTGTTTLTPTNSQGKACNIQWEPPDLRWGGGVLSAETVSIGGGSFTATPEDLELDRIAASHTLTISVNPGDGVIDFSALTPLPGDARWFSAGKQIILKTDNLRLPPGVELGQLMSPIPQLSPGEITRLVCATPFSGAISVQRGETISLILAGGNCGSADDTLAVDASDSSGWLQSGVSEVVPLQSMEYVLREMRIVVPDDASPGDFTELRWTVRSLSDPTISETSEIRYEVSESPCLADLNGDGLIEFPDYLIFLDLYDTDNPRVDFTRDGVVDVVDYFDFLDHYDAGC